MGQYMPGLCNGLQGLQGAGVGSGGRDAMVDGGGVGSGGAGGTAGGGSTTGTAPVAGLLAGAVVASAARAVFV
jgi:hypothetical protein